MFTFDFDVAFEISLLLLEGCWRLHFYLLFTFVALFMLLSSKLWCLHLIMNYELKWISRFQFFVSFDPFGLDFLVGFMFTFPSCCIAHVTYPFRKLLGLHLITNFELKWISRFQFLISFCSFENGFKGIFRFIYKKKNRFIFAFRN